MVPQSPARRTAPGATLAAMALSLSLPFPAQAGPPEQLVDQGLDANEASAAAAAIAALLDNAAVDMVMTYRVGSDGIAAYEVRARRVAGDALLRFTREIVGDGYAYSVVESAGPDLLARDDPRALSTFAEEIALAGPDGLIEADEQFYPYLMERVSVLFDDPNSGDILYFEKPAEGSGGDHGSLDLTQSRAPLILSGAGIADVGVGELNRVDTLARVVDVAPTVAALLGVERRDGFTMNGLSSAERGTSNDLYLLRQDGRVLDELLEPGGAAEHSVILILDGMSPTLMREMLELGDLPNIRTLVDRGVLVEYGSIAGFPTVTYPNHNSVGIGAYPTHHGLVGNHYYDRARRELVDPIDDLLMPEDRLNDRVETLFEAVHRTFGDWGFFNPGGAYTASVNDQCTRGADYATLELRFGFGGEGDAPDAPDFELDIALIRAADNYAVSQFQRQYSAFWHPTPKHVQVNFGMTDSAGHLYGPMSTEIRGLYRETDDRVGALIDALIDAGIFDDTAIVLTADHGMEQVGFDYDARSVDESLTDAGIRFVRNGRGVYLLTLDVTLSETGFVLDQPVTTVVTVRDDDLDVAGVRPPVAGAQVTVDGGGEVIEGVTDAAGELAVTFTPRSSVVDFSVSHPGFSARVVTLPVAP